MAGWLAGKAAITLVFVQVPRLLDRVDDSPSVAPSAGVQITLGVLLLLAGLGTWRRPQKPVRAPKWLERLKDISPPWAAAVGVALTFVNPKVLLTCAAAGYLIGHAGLSVPATGAGIAYFTAVAGPTAAVPILAYAINAHRVDPLLERFATWLRLRGRMLVVGILALVGVVLIVVGATNL